MSTGTRTDCKMLNKTSFLRSSKFSSPVLLTIAMLLLFGCNNSTPSPEVGNDHAAKNGTAPEPSGLSSTDYQRAFTLRNRGVAHLENKEWADAEKALSELAQLLPKNRLAVRNLAVSRVLALIDSETPYTVSGPPENLASFKRAVRAAGEALKAMKAHADNDYDNALAKLLMGKLFIKDGSSEPQKVEQGIMFLRSAADELSDAADFRFALAMAMDADREYSDSRNPKSAALLEALSKSFELAPQNLFALQKLLLRQAHFINAKNEGTKALAMKLPETLKAAVPLLKPLRESLKKNFQGKDLIAFIETTLEGYDGSDPMQLMMPASYTANLLLPDIATQIDQRRLNKNLLEYLLFEFDADFMAAAEAAGAISASEPTVIESFGRIVDKLGLPPENVSPSVGGTDVEIADMDLDGFDDIVIVGGGSLRVFSRGSDLSAAWQPMMRSPDGHSGMTNVIVADIDRDYDKALSDIKNPSLLRDADGDQKIATDPAGKNRWYDTDPDVIAWGKDGVLIMRNTVAEDGTRALEVLPQKESVKDINDVVAADLESDGDLDLIFATGSGITLWQNIDGTTFKNIDDTASLPTHEVKSLSVVDWNQDVAIDVVGLGASGEFGCLENNLHGRFRWKAEPYDGGRDSTFWIAGTPGKAGWQAVGSKQMQLPEPLTSVVTGDFDNDGNTDALCVAGDQTTLVRGLADGSFVPTDFIQLDGPAKSMAAADLDDDGDLDVICSSPNGGEMVYFRNDGGNSNSWIDVVARAVPDDPQFPSNRVNMHGIGSTIEVRAGDLYHAEVIAKPRVHLGLGKATSADAIRIIWTDGIPQNVTVQDLLRPRIGILAPQILKGSCPYIYTWTGERFEFFSDCLWAAPLGLVQANGDLAPTRYWENLLIPGEALAEKDGRYVLQLTEELWETAYFDQVELTAIDHPADVEIFTNEKVGPPSIAEHRVHTVKNPRRPLSILDSRGNDLLPGLMSQDGDYVQAFSGRIMQGLTDNWWMEFNLGDLDQPKDIRLFLTGWVFPTDTSLNLGIHQNPNIDPPAPPSIEVPDGKGGWKIARPFIGFPSGKTKAMVVDISDLFANNDYRFRIRSSMELYWDEAFFTVNEDNAPTAVQYCRLDDSNLHFRGFSRRVYNENALFRNGRAPESYDYESVTTNPRWPPISGRFTRYGETTPLLAAHDDQIVVMGPGDELTVSFAVPPNPVPKGWTRDFVLTNVGYDKDADLNTLSGQSSEPFPFRRMSQYPSVPLDESPDSSEYSRYIDAWQTREYSPWPFWNTVRNGTEL